MKWRGIEHMPKLYAVTTRRSEHRLGDLRSRLVGSLTGKVLELGCGIGSNLPHYGPNANVIASDIDLANLAFAQRRYGQKQIPFVATDAQYLPFPSASFAHVVATLVLCSVPFQALALGEIARILQPDGRLHLVEHTQTGHKSVDWLLDRIEQPWQWVTGGCHPNRDTVGMLEACGWRLVVHQRLAAGLLNVIVAEPPVLTSRGHRELWHPDGR